MVRYFSNSADIGSAWEHVASAFWRRYPNPFSAHVLTEDVLHRELTADGRRLLSRRLLTKTSRLVPPRWLERFLPGGGADNATRCVVHLLEDSVVDPVSRSLTTYTTNVSHTALMKVEERCVFRASEEEQPSSSSTSSSSSSSTQLRREVWISSGVYGFNRAIQEVALARYKANQRNAMKGLEYALSRLHDGGEPSSGTDTTMKDEG